MESHLSGGREESDWGVEREFEDFVGGKNEKGIEAGVIGDRFRLHDHQEPYIKLFYPLRNFGDSQNIPELALISST